MSKIIIISRSNDVHIPYVSKHLDPTEIIIIDPLHDIVKGDSIDYQFRNNTTQLLYKGHLLSGVDSVWFRKPTLFEELQITIEDKDRQYIQTSLHSHAQALQAALGDAYWISDRGAVQRANSKLYQNKVAASVGLIVPDTLYASSAAAAKSFVDEHKLCITKTQSTSSPHGKLFFTKLISSQDKIRFDGLRYDPFIFQQYIEPADEIRVTVVGTEVFAASVSGQGTDDAVSKCRDWRVATFNKSLRVKPLTLPPQIAKQCITLVRRLGLAFGAIDFVVDSKGKHWFLEINPNGQWAFIEEAIGQPIGRAIADLLQTATKKA